ncbi:MAG: alpha/beta fold hydrolase [Planctomycetales bacterium]
MNEVLFPFPRSNHIVGVLTRPDSAAQRVDPPAVVLVNAGFVHRVGPNRIHVKLARRLAALGFPVLRFDFSGIGDSRSRRDDVPFDQQSIVEIEEALDQMSAAGLAQRFLLAGICSGATNSLRVARHDRRVVGAALINGVWKLGLDSSEIKQLHSARYYRRLAVLDPRSWIRVMTGRSNYRVILRTAARSLASRYRRHKPQPVQERSENSELSDFRAVVESGAHLLLVCSERDRSHTVLTAMAGPLAELRATDRFRSEVIRDADHTFDLCCHQREVIDLLCGWAESVADSPPVSPIANVAEAKGSQTLTLGAP